MKRFLKYELKRIIKSRIFRLKICFKFVERKGKIGKKSNFEIEFSGEEEDEL